MVHFDWKLGAGRMPVLPRAAGFTLIELLVVVAIISILASIAVPNFLEAQTRAKVSRVKADMRSIATALEAYAVDHNKYPPRQYTGGSALQRAFPNALTRVQDLSRITTPISYMSTVPIDVFENKVAPPNNVLDYWSPGVFLARSARPDGTFVQPFYRGWALVSVGPDGVMGQHPQNAGNLPVDLLAFGTFLREYDPTNGTISWGNVSRIQSGQIIDEVFR